MENEKEKQKFNFLEIGAIEIMLMAGVITEEQAENCVRIYKHLVSKHEKIGLVLTQLSPEPLLHTGKKDRLPDFHPLAFKTVYCDSCKAMVHAGNNECMKDWQETSEGNFCCHCSE
jgi:hypothetical protein